MNKWMIWWRRRKINRMIIKRMRKRKRDRCKSILQKSNKVTKTNRYKKIKMTMKVKSLLSKWKSKSNMILRNKKHHLGSKSTKLPKINRVQKINQNPTKKLHKEQTRKKLITKAHCLIMITLMMALALKNNRKLRKRSKTNKNLCKPQQNRQTIKYKASKKLLRQMRPSEQKKRINYNL